MMTSTLEHDPARLAADTGETDDARPSLLDLQDEPYPVRQALSALGRLLGAHLDRPVRNLRTFVRTHLGVDAAEIAVTSSRLRGLDWPLVCVALGRMIEQASSAVVADDTGCNAPGYELVSVGVEEQVAAPDDLAAYLPASEGFGVDAVVVVHWTQWGRQIELHTRRVDTDAARVALSRLIERARTVDNFYRGATLRVTADENGVAFTHVAASTADRADVIHPRAVWAEVDTNVGGLRRHLDALIAAGLGAARGILVAGPPGVGKTALCRVIAAELEPGTTVLLVDATIGARGIGAVYELIPTLAPAAVFLDDIDLLAGDRRGGTAGPMLREFLTHLDGFTPQAAVITIATTNVTETIDPALVRPGRFDAVIRIDTPDRAARTRILARYLSTFGEFDLGSVAEATAGASGADLREIVRRAVLEEGAALSVATLLEVVSTGRWQPQREPVGNYL